MYIDVGGGGGAPCRIPQLTGPRYRTPGLASKEITLIMTPERVDLHYAIDKINHLADVRPW